MSGKKPAQGTPAAAKAAKPEDLTRSELPRGQHAYWYTREELPLRHEREIDVYDTYLMPRLRELALAQGLIDEDGNTITKDGNLPGMMPAGLSIEESRMVFEMQDVNVWAFLKGWTLQAPGGGARPLPGHADDLLNLERDIYEALISHAAKIIASRVQFETTGDQFDSQAGFTDHESPSGA